MFAPSSPSCPSEISDELGRRSPFASRTACKSARSQYIWSDAIPRDELIELWRRREHGLGGSSARLLQRRLSFPVLNDTQW
jgi:hypothetical protein